MLARQYRPYLMWLFPLMFFAYQFILRLWPGLMMQSIMEQFSVDASGFGLLAACYYYGYAGMQIPVAVLLERYGARKIIFLFATLCGFAMFLFTQTNYFPLALLSRFLIGAGSAVGFLGVSQVIAQWFKQDRYANMVGFSFSFGLLGAIYGGKPLGVLLTRYDSQSIALVLSVVSILIGLCVLVTVKNKTSESTLKEKLCFSDLKHVLSSPNIWVLAIANLLMVGALEGFADVWGISYLMTAYHYSKSESASLVSFIFIGMIFGGPALALLAKRYGNYVILKICGLCLSALFSCLLFYLNANWYLLCAIFFIIGMLCCYQVLVFAAGTELVPIKLLGVTVAFLNCINMLGGSFFHTLIGILMDVSWNGSIDPLGVRVYSITSYQYALSIIPISATLGAALLSWLGKKINKSIALTDSMYST